MATDIVTVDGTDVELTVEDGEVKETLTGIAIDIKAHLSTQERVEEFVIYDNGIVEFSATVGEGHYTDGGSVGDTSLFDIEKVDPFCHVMDGDILVVAEINDD